MLFIVTFTINIPGMLAYIYHTWIVWVFIYIRMDIYIYMIISEYNYIIIILYIYTEVSYNVSYFCLHLAYFSWPSSSSPAALPRFPAQDRCMASQDTLNESFPFHTASWHRETARNRRNSLELYYSTILFYGLLWGVGRKSILELFKKV